MYAFDKLLSQVTISIVLKITSKDNSSTHHSILTAEFTGEVSSHGKTFLTTCTEPYVLHPGRVGGAWVRG